MTFRGSTPLPHLLIYVRPLDMKGRAMTKWMCFECQVCACDCCWEAGFCRHCGHKNRVQYDPSEPEELEKTYKVGDTLTDSYGLRRKALICEASGDHTRVAFINVEGSTVWNYRIEEVKDTEHITRAELNRFGFRNWS